VRKFWNGKQRVFGWCSWRESSEAQFFLTILSTGQFSTFLSSILYNNNYFKKWSKSLTIYWTPRSAISVSAYRVQIGQFGFALKHTQPRWTALGWVMPLLYEEASQTSSFY
jgi:hypothetical protein